MITNRVEIDFSLFGIMVDKKQHEKYVKDGWINKMWMPHDLCGFKM